jgi:hypothetical protein
LGDAYSAWDQVEVEEPSPTLAVWTPGHKSGYLVYVGIRWPKYIRTDPDTISEIDGNVLMEHRLYLESGVLWAFAKTCG